MNFEAHGYQNGAIPPANSHQAVTRMTAASEEPFAALTRLHGRPLKVAILSDFTRIPYANGTIFQTRALYRALHTCGHSATLIGPRDPEASAE